MESEKPRPRRAAAVAAEKKSTGVLDNEQNVMNGAYDADLEEQSEVLENSSSNHNWNYRQRVDPIEQDSDMEEPSEVVKDSLSTDNVKEQQPADQPEKDADLPMAIDTTVDSSLTSQVRRTTIILRMPNKRERELEEHSQTLNTSLPKRQRTKYSKTAASSSAENNSSSGALVAGNEINQPPTDLDLDPNVTTFPFRGHSSYVESKEPRNSSAKQYQEPVYEDTVDDIWTDSESDDMPSNAKDSGEVDTNKDDSGEEGADGNDSGEEDLREENTDEEDGYEEKLGDENVSAKVKEVVPAKVKKATLSKPKVLQVKKDTYKYAEGIASGKPIDNIQDMLRHLVHKMLDRENLEGVEEILKLRVGTVCSGTDIPIVMLEMAANYLHLLNTQDKNSFELLIEHTFSAELVAWKQAYINRNFNGTVFRDVRELSNEPDKDGVYTATTIFNTKAEVPRHLDILIAGFCCVDFSALNCNKKSLDDLGESGDTFYSIKEYLRLHEPKIVILENVCSAPWAAKIPTQAAIDNAIAQALKKEMKMPKESKIPLTREMKTEICDRETLRMKKKGETSIRDQLKEYGYISKHRKVDAKDYYIPQTRERTYLVGINVRKFEESMSGNPSKAKVEQAIEKALDRWDLLMQKFCHVASVSVDAMLVAAEDDSEPAMSRVEELDLGDKKAIQWKKCKANHIGYRQLNGYGTARKLTNWLHNGFRKAPDHWAPLKGMTDRVADVLEISHLRNIVRGFDDRFYSRYLELSQNVYRIQDTGKDGVVSCLLPRGNPFWTYKGRRLSGRESLALQGIPVNLLDLSQLKDTHLQDLTGNAMTSTVVAAVMFSAIVVFKDFLGTGGEVHQPRRTDAGKSRLMELLEGMTTHQSDPTAVTMPLSVQSAMCMAAKTVSLCQCEGRYHKFDKKFGRCEICRHTGCVECMGNPAHSFVSIKKSEVDCREPPAAFQDQLENALPMKISLSELGNAINGFANDHPSVQHAAWEDLSKFYNVAVSSSLYMTKISRGTVWEIIYQSPNAKIVLTISGTQVQWLLYVITETDDISSTYRQFFDTHPIARLIPVGNDVAKGNWEVFVPTDTSVDVTITSSGALNPSYEAHIGLNEHQGQSVFNRCSVAFSSDETQYAGTEIAGEYEAHPSCGQAFASLHIKTSTKNDENPIYFFLDHTKQQGDHRTHHFVFTHDIRRQKPTEQRMIIARLTYKSLSSQTEKGQEVSSEDMPWRQPKIKHAFINGVESNQTQLFSETHFNETPFDVVDLKIIEEAKVVVPGFWVKSSMSMITLCESLISYKHIPPALPPLPIKDNTCAIPLRILECIVNIPEHTAHNYPVGELTTLGPSNHLQIMQDFFWVMKRVFSVDGYLRTRQTSSSIDDDHQNWIPFALPSRIVNCTNCAPSRPELRWEFRVGKNADKQQPYEEPETAAIYEKAFKARPHVVNLDIAINRITKEISRSGFQAGIQISVNFETLVHRALFDLEPAGIMKNVKASVLLVTDEVVKPLESFKPFVFPNSRFILDNPELGLLPDGQSYYTSVQLPGELKLRYEQCRSVLWQWMRELDPPEFLEEVVVEEATKFGYKASAKVSRSRLAPVGGGCLFHPVGFGKTAVILGLIHVRKDEDETWALEEAKKSSGLIPLKATLIMVPPQLVHQWKEEVGKFLGDEEEKKVMVIAGLSEWQSFSIRDFQQASIVIVNWSLFEKQDYLNGLAQYGGMVGIDANAKVCPRGYASLHSTVMSRITANINTLRSEPSKFRHEVNSQIDESIKNIAENKKPVPSKRLTGAAYMNQNTKMNGKTVTARVLNPKCTSKHHLSHGPKPDEPWDATKRVPLEAFRWSRVVADEFPYMKNSAAETTLHGLEKKNLWLVSATPQLTDFEAVRQLASYFGVNLGAKDFTLMTPQEWKKCAVGMTSSEKFRAFDRPKSATWYKHRELQAQKFIDDFTLCDAPTYEQIKHHELTKVCVAPAAQMVASAELAQRLAIEDSGALSRADLGTSNHDFHIKQALKDSKTAVQALLKQASFFDLTADPGFRLHQAERTSALDVTVKCRDASLNAVKSDFQDDLMEIIWLSSSEEAGQGTEIWEIFQSGLQHSQWEDKELCTELQSFVALAKNRHPTDAFLERMKYQFPAGKMVTTCGKKKPLVEARLRYLVSQLSKTAGELLQQTRAVRLVKTVEAYQSQDFRSVICTCVSRVPGKNIIVLTGCGHMICHLCTPRGTICPASGCGSSYELDSMSPASVFDNLHNDISECGQKAEDLISLINRISKDKDKVLLFVQYEDMITRVKKILLRSDISCIVLNKKSDKTPDALVKFQKKTNKGSEAKVLILNIAGASAAGLNLTAASHIIFYAPFHTTGSNGQSEYDSSMAQAIGRAVRFGQKADYVKVYHMMTAYTADVDVFEHRRKVMVEADPEKPGEYKMGDRSEPVKPGAFASRVSYLVHKTS